MRARLNPSAGTVAFVAASTSSAIVRAKTAPLGGAPLLSPKIRDLSRARWNSMAVLVVAVVLGGFLRFTNLGTREMSADEGGSWAAASASSVRQVLELQPRLNPGKFAIHEISLHSWIRLFGDGLVAMRALSALAGTLGMVVVFFLGRELFGLSAAMTRRANENIFREISETPSYMLPAAFGAVLFAVNLVFIKYAQEARMYSVALLCGLTQVGFFLRSVHRPTPVAVLFAGLFTALAIASTFTMSMILAPEILWLAYLRWPWNKAMNLPVALVGLALMGGVVLLIPPAIIYLRVRAQAPPLLAYAWASPPPLWAPISMFNKATGSIAFPVLLGLAIWGVTRGWRLNRDAIVFALLWMLVPPILMLAGSYMIRPAFVERYVLASFVPFFLLVAFGTWNVRGFPAQCALLTLAALLSMGHIYSYRSHPHDVQWHEAVEAATLSNGSTIAVAPPYAADVVRYYLRDSHNRWSVAPGHTKSATVALVASSGVSAAETARMTAAYPRLVMHLRGVIVRAH
jgi:mannosyltransferase